MILYIAAASGLLWLIYEVFKEETNEPEAFANGCLGVIIFAFLVLAITTSFAHLIGYKGSECVDEVQKTVQLEAIHDRGASNASLFLGSGQINGEMVYTFYREHDSGYKLDQLSAQNSTIQYDTVPRIEYLKAETVYGNWFSRWFGINLNCGEERNIIYVPKGSIKQNYILDAK